MSDIRVNTGPPAHRFASTGTLTRGLPVGEVLEVPALAGARLIAGRAGLGRVVQRLNVMETPDFLPWVKPNELLLTTGYPLRGTPRGLDCLVGDLDERGVAALAIKPGRYLAEPPPDMVEQADRRGFPLILLPADVGFDDVMNQVLTDILNRQAAVLARTEEVHRALVQTVLCGGGLREVVDEVAAHLGASVAVLDGERRVLAATGTEDQIRAVRALALRGDTGPPVPAEGDHLVVPVVAGGFDHGRLVAYRPDGALAEGALGILERAATVAALVVTKQQAVAAVESKYRADFLRDILAGRAGDDDRVIAHCSGFGWDLDRPIVVIVAELDGRPRPEPDQAGQGAQNGQARPARPGAESRGRGRAVKADGHPEPASATAARPTGVRRPDTAPAEPETVRSLAPDPFGDSDDLPIADLPLPVDAVRATRTLEPNGSPRSRSATGTTDPSGRGGHDVGGRAAVDVAPGRAVSDVGPGRAASDVGPGRAGADVGPGRRGTRAATGRPGGGGPATRGGRGAEERATQERLAAAWAAAVRRHDRGAAVASFAHEVVAVVGADGDDPDVDGGPVHTLVKEAAALFAEHTSVRRSFSTGISRTVVSPARLPEAYEQALKAVRVGRQLHGDGARAHFDQLGVYRLLSLVPDPEELHAFVRETLGDLAADDEPELVDLRRTLQVLLETNLNVAETARRLHFHYNTLRYRIGKLERLLGPFTEDAHLRLNLTLALHVLRMRGI
ncbi:PucR family transcriptional regulator ligand-binding domain-containing protein [Spirillospora sp. NPDC052269]